MTPDGNLTLWSEPVLRAVASAARRVAKQHNQYVEYEDLQSEGYVWVGAHADKVIELVEGKHFGWLDRDLYRHMHKYAMRQRYLKDGTKPGDYYLYSPAVLTELLPEAVIGMPAEASPSDLTGVRANKPISERGDKAAMLADVQQAWLALDADDRTLLMLKFLTNGGATDQDVGALLGLPQQTVNYRINRVLVRMAEYLGGEPAPRRKAISNARAQYETRNQEGE